MSKRRLAAFAIPLEHRRWDLLRFDGQQWLLRERLAPCEERPLARIDVVLEGGAWRWLRLRVRVTVGAGSGHRNATSGCGARNCRISGP